MTYRFDLGEHVDFTVEVGPPAQPKTRTMHGKVVGRSTNPSGEGTYYDIELSGTKRTGRAAPVYRGVSERDMQEAMGFGIDRYFSQSFTELRAQKEAEEMTQRATSKDAEFTSLQGRFELPFNELVEKIGPPHESFAEGSGKVQSEWAFRFGDGVVATIYDYKTGQSYRGPAGRAPTDEYQWNIGGHDFRSVEHVLRLLGLEVK